MLALMLIIPYVFSIMCRFSGLASTAEIDFLVVTLFFFFQVTDPRQVVLTTSYP
jgi:hypothetical protein